MIITKKISGRVKPLGVSLTTGALVVAGLSASMPAAHAQPGSQAPSYGYPGNSDRQQATLTGTITREVQDNQFEFRTDDGRVILAEFFNRGRQPQTLSVGDRVSVFGVLQGTNMAVRNVRILREGENGYYNGDNGVGIGNRITLTGVVTSRLSADQFEFRGENGNVYRVEFYNSSQQPRNLSVGDRVTVYGDAQGNNIAALNVRIVRDGDGGYYGGGYNNQGYPNSGYPNSGYPNSNYPAPSYPGYPAPSYPNDGYYGGGNNNNGPRATLTGTVTRELNDDQFELRADDGRTYRVEFRNRSQRPTTLSAGDRVSVYGNVDGSNVGAFNVRIVQEGSGGIYDNNAAARSVNFPGTVTLVRSRTSLVVRGDNGRDYEVTTRWNANQTINRGDRVRIIGQANGDIVTAEQIVQTNNAGDYQGGYQNGYDDNTTFTGTVESSSLSSFRLRADDGRTYEVRYNASLLMRHGQRVRVEGTFNGNVIEARNVDNL